jgi:tRNA (guanosine-2'-O-)-methyltransferase
MVLDLDVERARRVREVLRPYLSEARRRRIAEVLDARTRAVTVVLEDIASDHNGAAVLRTAEALGLMEVHLVPPPAGFKVSRKVAMGSQKWLEIQRHSGIEAAYAALRARGFAIWASVVHGEAVPAAALPLAGPVALVFGNEHAGLSAAAAARADGRFRLPMYGFVESLNISVAAALGVSAVTERRRAAGRLEPLDADDRDVVEARWYVRSVRAARPLLAREGIVLEEEAPAVEVVDRREDAP